jgi:putative PIN family toxin of toxin-antitoxin system
VKLVVDTNVFISAFYWGGISQKVIDRIIKGIDELYISNEILDEIANVMARPKFKSGPETIDRYVKTIEKTGKKIFINGEIKNICRDKDDDDKIECALKGAVDFIITGDEDLLVLGEYQNIKIRTPKEYLEIVLNQPPWKKQ